MDLNRRTLIAGLGVGGLASLSGCLGLIGMDEHESTPAGVDADARDRTGYEQTGIEELVVEEEVGPDSISETIVVRNHLTEHEKTVDMGVLGEQRGAVFSVLSTPQIELAGQQFNPVEEMSAAELVDLIESNYDQIDDITFEEEEAITILEQATMRSRFSADAEFDGTSVEVDLHVSEAVATDDDLIVTIGVYPQELRGSEEDNVIALMEGVIEALEDAPATDEDENEDSEGDGEDDASDEDGEQTDDEESDDASGNETEQDRSSDGNESGDEDDGGLL